MKTKGGEIIQAKAENRDIEVELEALSLYTTRMRAAARNGYTNDSATALAIISQTVRLPGDTKQGVRHGTIRNRQFPYREPRLPAGRGSSGSDRAGHECRGMRLPGCGKPMRRIFIAC